MIVITVLFRVRGMTAKVSSFSSRYLIFELVIPTERLMSFSPDPSGDPEVDCVRAVTNVSFFIFLSC